MKFLETTKAVGVVAVIVASIAGITSCDGENGDARQGTTTVTAEKQLTERPLSERFEASFQMVMDSTNSWGTYLGDLGKLEEEVFQLPHDEALQVMESFIDMAIAAQPPPVPSADDLPWRRRGNRYNRRDMWFEKMYWVFQEVFYASRKSQQDPYEGWDKLFMFLGKYTNEIASLERSLRAKENRVTRGYMTDLKSQFGIMITQFGKRSLRTDPVVAIFKIPPTAEQRASLLGRFEEFKKYTDYMSTRRPYTFSTPPYEIDPLAKERKSCQSETEDGMSSPTTDNDD